MLNNSPASPKSLPKVLASYGLAIVKKGGHEPSENSSRYSLLVSFPTGTPAEFVLPERDFGPLVDALADRNLWLTFLNSLLASFEAQRDADSQASKPTT